MAFGVKRAELEAWKKRADSGEIAFLTHYWLDDRFPDSKTVTKAASADIEKLKAWGASYGFKPEWIDSRHNGYPHYDLFGEIQRTVLKKEGIWDQIERFHLDGDETMLKLENDALLVELKEDGAELTRIFDKNSQKEFLWHGDGEYWARRAPVLFPTVGRLVEDTYFVDGEAFHLGQHGFARDRVFQVVKQSDEAITLRLEYDEESLAIYPFRFALEIAYRLDGGTIHVGYHVENLDDKTMYFSIGAHPAFNVPFVAGETFEDYYLDFGAEEQLDSLTLAGAYLSGEKKEIGKTKKLPLNYELFGNDALIFEGLTKNEVTIRSRKNRHFVKVAFPDFKFVGLWTPKPGTPFLCIEPWSGIADTQGPSVELKDKQAIETLAIGAAFNSEYTITIG